MKKENGKWIYPLLISTVSVVGVAITIYVGLLVHNANKLHLIDRANTLAGNRKRKGE